MHLTRCASETTAFSLKPHVHLLLLALMSVQLWEKIPEKTITLVKPYL